MAREQLLPKPLAALPAPGLAWMWPVLVVATALVASLGSADASRIYALLERPDWAPPAAVFGPVWALLYGLMAVAALWVTQTRDPASAGPRRIGLALFGLALLPTALWSWCFFSWQRADWAMACILTLVLLLGAAVCCFGRVQRGAAWLLVPPLAWIGFAAVLNADLLLRNGPLLPS